MGPKGLLKTMARTLLARLGLESSAREVWELIRGTQTDGASPDWVEDATNSLESSDEIRFASWLERRFAQRRWEYGMRTILRRQRHCGVEYVTPFLEPDLFWAVKNLKNSEMWSPSAKKIALRTAVRGTVPDGIRKARKEGSFDYALNSGLTEEFISRAIGMVEDGHLEAHGLIDSKRFKHSFRDFQSRANSEPDTEIGIVVFFRTISAEVWMRRRDGP
jgi:hypothetical protein